MKTFVPCLTLSFLLAAISSATAFPIILNPSFENNTQPDVGYGPVDNWVIGGNAGGGGVNPTTTGTHPFWDNGTLVDGNRVAFLQNGVPTTLSQRIDGFKAGRGYKVTYYYNVRALNNPTPRVAMTVSVTLNGTVIDPEHDITAVEAYESYTTPFHKRTTQRFLAPADGAFDLVFNSRMAVGGYPDATTVFDYVVMELDPPEANIAPEMLPIADQSTYAGMTLSFYATATDANEEPVQKLTYSLEGEVPPGAVMDPESGQFTWQVPFDEFPGEYALIVTVTDSGVPVKSASQPVRIKVLSGPMLKISMEAAKPKIEWDAVAGVSYRLFYKDVLDDTQWLEWPSPFQSETGSVSFIDETAGSVSRYYRVQ